MARKRRLDVGEAPQIFVDLPATASCGGCGSRLHSGSRSRRSLWRLDGPVIVVTIARRCSNRLCPGWREYRRPVAEVDRLALRTGDFGLDVILEVGAMRFARRLSVPEAHAELREQYPHLLVSERQISRLLGDYTALTQASLRDEEALVAALGGRRTVTISIDGLQPDQDKETLWLIRDLESGYPLASLTLPSVGHVELGALLRSIGTRGLTVTGVVSDGQDCVVKAIREVMPEVPHQICQAHFLKNVAKPLIAKDGALRRQLKRGCADCEQSSVRSRPSPPPEAVVQATRKPRPSSLRALSRRLS